MDMIPFNLLASHCLLTPKKLYAKMAGWGLPLPTTWSRSWRERYDPLSVDEARDVLLRVYAEQGRTQANGRAIGLERNLQALRSHLAAPCFGSESAESE